jgi:uncharacterized protein YndB with AHSA1/START domain
MATSSGTAVVSLPADTDILITRVFDAPKHLVYRAYTTPELIRRWWSGNKGQMTVADVDLRVGGTWRYVMIAEGGFEVAFHGVYHEIVPEERLVFTEIYEGAPEPAAGEAAVNTVTFEEESGRTTLTMLTRAPNKEIRDLIINSGMESGMQAGMDLLEQIAISLK